MGLRFGILGFRVSGLQGFRGCLRDRGQGV